MKDEVLAISVLLEFHKKRQTSQLVFTCHWISYVLVVLSLLLKPLRKTKTKKTLFTLVLRVAMSLILAWVTGLARELHSCESTSLQLLWDCSTPFAGKVFVYQSSLHEYLKIKTNEITSPIGNQNKDKYFENLCWNYHQNQGSEVHV